jgi:hypothetical protein
LGATVETPTWYNIDDSYSEGLDTKYGRNKVDSSFVNDNSVYDFSYSLRTPLKVSGGIGLFIILPLIYLLKKTPSIQRSLRIIIEKY